MCPVLVMLDSILSEGLKLFFFSKFHEIVCMYQLGSAALLIATI